jgi:hypothetical protein
MADDNIDLAFLRAQNDRLSREMGALKGGGGGGTSGGMDTALIDAKVAASEARTDSKFARLDGKIDLLVERSTDARTEARATRRTVIGTGLSIAALLIAIFALYTSSFTLGSRISDVARAEARQTYDQLQARDAQRALPRPASNLQGPEPVSEKAAAK